MAIFFTVLIDLIGFGILIPILQPFAKGFGASDMVAIMLMGTYSLMQFIFSPVLGRISDRIGRRPVIIASLVGSMLGYLIIAAAPFCGSGAASIALLFLARVVTGICGASFSTAQAALADVTAPEKRAAVMGMIGAAFGIGFDNYYTTHSEENRRLTVRMYQSLSAGGHITRRQIGRAHV